MDSVGESAQSVFGGMLQRKERAAEMHGRHSNGTTNGSGRGRCVCMRVQNGTNALLSAEDRA